MHPSSRQAAPAQSRPSPPRDAASLAHRPPGDQGVSTRQADIARFFFELRRALALSTRDVARAIATPEEFVQALESGRLAALPAWPETVRAVTAYTRRATIDPRPVLHMMLAELAQATPAVATAAAIAEPAPWPAAPDTPPDHRGFRLGALRAVSDWGRAGHRAVVGAVHRSRAQLSGQTPATPRRQKRRPRLKTLLAIATPAALWIFASQTQLLYTVAAGLPSPIARLTRPVQDYVLETFAPVREGHRWIEVDDPRSRRRAKLPIRHH